MIIKPSFPNVSLTRETVWRLDLSQFKLSDIGTEKGATAHSLDSILIDYSKIGFLFKSSLDKTPRMTSPLVSILNACFYNVKTF